jgi:hypothetical protein
MIGLECNRVEDTSSRRMRVDLGAQSDLIGAPKPISIEPVLAAPERRLCARLTQDRADHAA